MRRVTSAIALAVLVAGCGGSGASPTPSVPIQSTAPSPAGAPATASAATSAAATAAPSAAALPSTPPETAFTLCPSPGTGPTCPLTPSDYTAAIHDAFTLTIADAGWQEERGPVGTNDEPTVILSRVDDPAQRVVIDTGPTREVLDPTDISSMLAGLASAQASAPVPATVGGANGLQVDLAPTAVLEAPIGEVGTYAFQPGHRYRVMALQLGMGQESGQKVIIVDAPTGSFDAFLPSATKVLSSLQF